MSATSSGTGPAVIVVADGRAVCRKLRDVRAGDTVVCGVAGVRVIPEFQERARVGVQSAAGYEEGRPQPTSW